MIELKPREGSDARVLAIVAAGTLLTLVAFTTVIPTVQDTAVDLDAGPAGQTWALSSMSLGLAGARRRLPRSGRADAGSLGQHHNGG